MQRASFRAKAIAVRNLEIEQVSLHVVRLNHPDHLQMLARSFISPSFDMTHEEDQPMIISVQSLDRPVVVWHPNELVLKRFGGVLGFVLQDL